MFLLSTTSHKAHDSNLYVSVLFGENQQCTANDLLMSYIVRLFGSWDPTIDRNGSEDNITSAKGHHVCLIILLLQSSFMMRMNLLCVRTFSLCNMSRAVLSVPYFSGTPIVVTGHQHRRQATRKTELSDLARLPTHQLSTIVSHFVSTHTLHITLLE
jgi:hypothetical protein